MGAGFPTVAGGIEPLWEVRKDTDAAPLTRARTPTAATRLNRRELTGRRWTLARGMFSGMVSRRRGLGRRPGSARGGRTRRIRQPRPFLGKRRCSVLACCSGRHWLPDTAGVVPLLIGEAVGGGGDVVPELRRHMSSLSRMMSSLLGQALASSQAVRSGPPRSSRPWISTAGMPTSRCASRSSWPSSSHAPCRK